MAACENAHDSAEVVDTQESGSVASVAATVDGGEPEVVGVTWVVRAGAGADVTGGAVLAVSACLSPQPKPTSAAAATIVRNSSALTNVMMPPRLFARIGSEHM